MLLRNVPLPAGQVIGLVALVLLDGRGVARLPGSRVAHRLTGAMAVCAGCALNVWAVNERRRRESGEFDLERPEALVTTGPYAFTRHPMYLGWWIIHAGVGVFRGSAWILATLPISMLAEHHSVIAEELALVRIFGDEYTGYARLVPRYVRFTLDRSPLTGKTQPTG
jgi:protein-S-isoprenylcysteine O-methyltransferase Ste14